MSDIQRMIEEIEAAVEDDALNLTEWESDFLESIKVAVQVGQDLSEKQEAVLLKLWQRANA